MSTLFSLNTLFCFAFINFFNFTENYWEFHKWTVDNLCQFWADLWNFSGVICSKTYDKVLRFMITLNSNNSRSDPCVSNPIYEFQFT